MDLVLNGLQESVELRPMFGAADAADASAASDSGGASFLGQLWQAVQVRALQTDSHGNMRSLFGLSAVLTAATPHVLKVLTPCLLQSLCSLPAAPSQVMAWLWRDRAHRQIACSVLPKSHPAR